METIDVVDGKFHIPPEHELSINKRKLTVKTPWCSQVMHLDKEAWQTTVQQWYRHKASGDKPYIPEGFIELDGKRYKVNVMGGKDERK